MNEPFRVQCSRRAALSGGLAVGLEAWLGPAVRAAPPQPAQLQLPLITREIPVSGEPLPAVGLGTDQFRESDRDAIQDEIRRMHEMGGTVIDTAAAYGDSEAIIGDVLAALKLSGKMFIATKLTASGRGFFGGDGVAGEQSFERSLKRLQVERIDLLQVHNLDGVDELMPMLSRLKQTGKIRYIGITTSRVAQHAQMVELMRKHPLDFVQVDYSLANRDAAMNVLPLAHERHVAVLANIPFGFGSVIRKAQSRPLPEWASQIDVATWGQFLLKYVISHPAVTCSIPGSTRVSHLEDNQLAARGRLPDEAMRRRMEQYWDAG